MTCMKCGKETNASQVFCNECLTEMEKHPVKPDTPVQLPQRPTQDKPSPRTREQTPADTIRSLRGLVRWLTILITILSLLLCATAAFLLHTLDKSANDNPIGRNYTTNTTGTTP